jgi:hypothetical protein
LALAPQGQVTDPAMAKEGRMFVRAGAERSSRHGAESRRGAIRTGGDSQVSEEAHAVGPFTGKSALGRAHCMRLWLRGPSDPPLNRLIFSANPKGAASWWS